ncbi:hypothetical protein AVEN_23080-1 [Araneus ventricosus]|uniref:Uncharacterized protein n=1 Tax=Araneus ventricosus TaxID=182803 RepID=A0A4Y2UAN7_ARAVE|nr:hypothetical protein AVEN_23080-1 [Araneus ventricosus]
MYYIIHKPVIHERSIPHHSILQNIHLDESFTTAPRNAKSSVTGHSDLRTRLLPFEPNIQFSLPHHTHVLQPVLIYGQSKWSEGYPKRFTSDLTFPYPGLEELRMSTYIHIYKITQEQQA